MSETNKEGPFNEESAYDEIARLTRELEEARRERSAAKAEALNAQASLRRVERELEEARVRERAIVEACAAVCESRAKSHHREKAPPGWLDRALEAQKCASAIREGWRLRLTATPQEATDAR